MKMHSVLQCAAGLLVGGWLNVAAVVAEEADDSAGVGPVEVVEAYVSEAVATVNRVYDSGLDGAERSTLIGQSGISDYWVSSRQTTIAGTGSSAAFAVLLSFRPDSWQLGTFRQAGDFGEIAAEFSRTKTFRSGGQSTSTRTLVYELVKSEDRWAIASFRKIKPEATAADAQASAWEANASAVSAPADSASPLDVVRAQLDLLRGLPPQALRSASEKSSGLWLDTREARQGQGRVISMAAAMAGFSGEPVEWSLTLEEEGASSATVKALVVADKPAAFGGLRFSLERIDNQWLLSAATATR
jgi:hypothetical protein